LIKIRFVQPDGTEKLVECKSGWNAMGAAVQAMVPGIIGDCGGSCTCATCHVYVDEEWQDKITPATNNEREMLDFADNVQVNSRLSCQIKIREESDGLTLYVPLSDI